ncbi:MAG TPA: hypothetical protein VKQ70_05830 [Caulobacteraceae bacterium]|nr:hypothetical protein [Caulobacteraceae bacterium]
MGDAAITVVGILILALLAVALVGLWGLAARTQANRENPDDPALDALRRRRLVVRRRAKERGQQAIEVAELEPTSESGR